LIFRIFWVRGMSADEMLRDAFAATARDGAAWLSADRCNAPCLRWRSKAGISPMPRGPNPNVRCLCAGRDADPRRGGSSAVADQINGVPFATGE
jgi:hypothetical protein